MTPDEIARNLANDMAQHIIGEAFAAKDETCAECIRMASDAIAAAIRAERERTEKAERERDAALREAPVERRTLGRALANKAASMYADECADLRAERDRLRDALEPFARAGELFVRNPLPEGSVMMIYGPAAGSGYSLSSDHLVAAHAALRKTAIDTAGGSTVNTERT